MQRRAILFDGDDTLWMTQPLYKSVLDESYVVLEQQGFAPVLAHSLFNAINARLLETIKLSAERLGQAMVETYETLCVRGDLPVRPGVGEALRELAGQVFLRAPLPLVGLHETLTLLAQDFDLFFYSGGVVDTQCERLTRLDLHKYFGQRLFIVTQKDDASLMAILRDYELDPATTWIVGNSPRFEINPGLRLGLNCIWMHTSFWTLDLEDISGQTYVAFTLPQVTEIIARGSGFAQEYTPPADVAQELQSALADLAGRSEVWLVGTSPRLDINPAMNTGVRLIWMPTALGYDDLEPMNGRVSVAFSRAGAEQIIARESGGSVESVGVIWRVRAAGGDLVERLVID